MSIASFRNKTGMKRKVGALVLAASVLCISSVSQPTSAQSGSGLGAPVEGTWLNTITRINQGGATFTAVVSFAGGGVWQATGSTERQNGGVSTLVGSWKRIGYNLYSSRAYFYAFDPSGNPVVLLRVDQLQRLINKNHLVGVGQGYVCSLQGNGQDCVRTPEVDITIAADRVVPQG